MKKGFSIIELMVVMTIMAMITTLGISTLINVRKSSEIDKAAEDTLMLIRETQNNSIAVKNDSEGNATKVWVTNFQSSDIAAAGYDPNTVKIYSWYPSDGNLEQKATPEKTLRMPTGVNLKVYDNEGEYRWSGLATYAVPFGMSNILVGSHCRVGTDCHWEVSQKPTREWYVKFLTALGQSYVYNATNNPEKNMTIKIEGNGHSKKIIIKASGDAFIQ